MFLKVENVFVLLLSSPNKLSRSTQKLFVQKSSRVMIGNFSSRRVRFSRVYFKGLDEKNCKPRNFKKQYVRKKLKQIFKKVLS